MDQRNIDKSKAVEMIIRAALDLDPLTDKTRAAICEAYPFVKDELIQTCQKQKMQPFVAKRMLDLRLDVETWQVTLNSYRIRNNKAKQELEQVFQALSSKGMKNCYPIENFAVLLNSDEDIAMFASGDIDVYAGQTDHEKVHATMSDLGYVRTVANEYQGYYYRKSDNPVGINMMWMWQSRQNLPFRTKLDVQNVGGGVQIL